MNEYLVSLLHGFVQGATEFLPVSSSGHLVLLEKVGFEGGGLLTELLLHCATLAAVLIRYRKKIFFLITRPLCEQNKFILLASVPTALFAGTVRFFLPDLSSFLPLCFGITSFLLLLPKLVRPCAKKPFPSSLHALSVGCMQGVACLSGISRSGSTATALYLCGCPKEEIGEYSFLLSVPIIIGSSAVEIAAAPQESWHPSLLLGCAAAFGVGTVAIKLFEKLLSSDKMHYFSVYTAVMAVVSFFLIFR